MRLLVKAREEPDLYGRSRGRLARWLQEKVDAGHDKETYRVPAAATESPHSEDQPKRSRRKEANA